MKNLLKRLLAAPFVFVAAIIILLEDWLRDDLQRLAAAIGRLPIFHQIESFIAGLPPYGALAMFATPSLLLVPVKKATSIYRAAHLRYTRMKEWLRNRGRSFLRRRWDAAIKLSRRWR